MPGVEQRSHKGLNNRAKNSHLPVRRQLQRFVSIHAPIANLFHTPRYDISASYHRELRTVAMSS